MLALQDVSLEVHPGEVLGLVGENGAGKSTLMKILSGVYQPDGGEIILDGKPVILHSPRQAQDLGISIIYQEFNLMPNLSVEENVFVGREPNAGKVVRWRQLRKQTTESARPARGAPRTRARSSAPSRSPSSRWSRSPRRSRSTPGSSSWTSRPRP